MIKDYIDIFAEIAADRYSRTVRNTADEIVNRGLAKSFAFVRRLLTVALASLVLLSLMCESATQSLLHDAAIKALGLAALALWVVIENVNKRIEGA